MLGQTDLIEQHLSSTLNLSAQHQVHGAQRVRRRFIGAGPHQHLITCIVEEASVAGEHSSTSIGEHHISTGGRKENRPLERVSLFLELQ